MQGQDWKPVIFNTPSNKNKQEQDKKKYSNKPINPEESKLEQPKNLGKLISQARQAKSLNQKQLANQMGISIQLLARIETNKEIINNQDIAKIEKITGVKLPRNKKVKISDI